MASDFVAGCLGGCAGILVSYPFDTVKVHLQTQDHRNPVYRGTWHCLKTIVGKDSVRGLFRGMTSPLAGVAAVNAIVFGVYGNVQRTSTDPNSIYSHFLAGSIAGLAQSVVCSPMELIKTRLQLQNNQNSLVQKFKNPLECTQHIYRNEGVRGIFRGLTITAVRDTPAFASYFVSYELMIRLVTNPTPFHILMAGGLAGTISWICTFPIDTVKSRLQADGVSSKPMYNGVKDCIQKSYKNEGLSFLMKGLGPTLIRAFPMNAVCFLVVSWTLKFFEKSSMNLNLNSMEQQLAIVPTVTTEYHSMAVKHLNEDFLRLKQHTYKSLKFLGAFSEAVCCTEMDELAHDLYSSEDYGYYYLKMNDFLFNSQESDEVLPFLSN
uniref:Putative mitochondrial carnitine-acylcarnitine carrier protein n=1 Tax=Corethrella appendiculata TaxID=1370023 RepID=U5EXE6_9DIPT